MIMDRLSEICAAKGIEVGPGALADIAAWAQGGMRDALSLLDQCAGMGKAVTRESLSALLGSASPERLFSMAEGLLGDDVVPVIEHLDAFIQEGGDLETLISDLIGHLRNVMMALLLPDPSDVIYTDAATLSRYRDQAQKTSRERLLRALDRLIELQAELRYSEQPRMLIEMAFVDICRPLPEESYDDLLDKLDRLSRLAAGLGGQTERQEPTPAKTPEPPADKPQPKAEKETPPAMEPAAADETTAEAAPEENPGAEAKGTITGAWRNLMKKMKKQNPPLAMVLAKSHITEESEHILELAFAAEDEIYKNSVMIPEKREWLQGFIREELGKTVDIRVTTTAIPSPEPDLPMENPEEVIQSVMDFFGGEYVEATET